MSRHRNLIRNPRFEEDLRKLPADVREVDEALEGLEWVLARSPERGAPVGEPPLRAWPVYRWGLELLVFYIFDEESVTLLFMKVAPTEWA